MGPCKSLYTSLQLLLLKFGLQSYILEIHCMIFLHLTSPLHSLTDTSQIHLRVVINIHALFWEINKDVEKSPISQY